MFQQVFTEPVVEMYYILSGYHSGATSLDPPPWVMPEYYVLPVDLKTPDGVDQYHMDTLGIGFDIQCTVIPRNRVLFECPGHLNSSEESSNCPPYPYRSDYPLVTILNDPCVPQDRHFMDWVGWMYKTNDANGPSDLNSFDAVTPSNICPGTFYAGWLEGVLYPSPLQDPLVPESLRQRENTTEGLVIKCTAVDEVVNLRASIDSKMHVLNYTVVAKFNSSEVRAMYHDKLNGTLATTFLNSIEMGWEDEQFIGDFHRIRWLNYLIKNRDSSTVRPLVNITHIPNETNIANVFQYVYRELFVINLHLNVDQILGPREPLPESSIVQTTVVVERAKMSYPMFIIAVTILAIMIMVLVVICWGRRQAIGHVPESLVGMYALL